LPGSLAEALDQPLPKPGRDLLGYASVRVLEALLEAVLALEFLERGYTRNAAGKAFQAWRALTGALLALESDRVAGRLGGEEQRRWLLEKAVPRVPSSRLKFLARLLKEAGYLDFPAYTAVALDLHDYQYHGPDPDLEYSKYRGRGEAAYEMLVLLTELAEIVKEQVRSRLEREGKWTQSHEKALQRLWGKLAPGRQR